MDRRYAERLGELRERLEAKGRLVPFGVEVMGRVRELGTLDDVLTISSQLHWVRPVIDFAHLHAVTDGGFTSVEPFTSVLAAAEQVLEAGAPFHIHFSDISFANRNEKAHLPYGQGTLRAEPLAVALARFDREATVIGESPDESSNQAIRLVLLGGGRWP
jgi:deoxyribonuclease IV